MSNGYLQDRDCTNYNNCCGDRCRCNPYQPKPQPPKCCLCPYIGPTGDMGPAGPQGVQGPQGIPGNIGPTGPQGHQGMQGATGPTGPDGLAATIEIDNTSRVPFDNNPYVINVGTPNAAILRFGIPAGMPGTPGEQGAKGETGPAGPQGIQGEAGPIGPQGIQGEAGPTGPQGIQGEAGPTGPQGIQGETGPTGPQGIQGETGPIGPQGIQGEAGPIGPQGIQGETGPTGPIAAMIPFSISKYGTTLTVGEDGEPMMVAFSGFSPAYSSATYLQEGEWRSGYIRIREDVPYPTSFVMTFNGTVKKIYVLFSTYYSSDIAEGTTIQPFACLAISTTDELVYQILPETLVYADPYVGGVVYPTHTIRKGSRTDLNVDIPEGALVAIITGIIGTGIEGEQSATLSISGGLYLE